MNPSFLAWRLSIRKVGLSGAHLLLQEYMAYILAMETQKAPMIPVNMAAMPTWSIVGV